MNRLPAMVRFVIAGSCCIMVHVTLLSDLGLLDASVGAVKGILIGAVPDITITDISHELPPFKPVQAAYLLRTLYDRFPEGTFHLVLADVYAAETPRLIWVQWQGHNFLAPDNGILAMALDAGAIYGRLCATITAEKTFKDLLRSAAAIVAGGVNFTGLPEVALYQKTMPVPTEIDGGLDCQVLYIDNYGNVVTNLRQTDFEQRVGSRPFRIRFMQVNEVRNITQRYSNVSPGDYLCRFNHAGYMEICINQGSAADLFGFRLDSTFNDIKILFQ